MVVASGRSRSPASATATRNELPYGQLGQCAELEPLWVLAAAEQHLYQRAVGGSRQTAGPMAVDGDHQCREDRRMRRELERERWDGPDGQAR
jgi:hypothetical protein